MRIAKSKGSSDSCSVERTSTIAAGTEAEDFDRQLRSSRSLPRTIALSAEPPAGL